MFRGGSPSTPVVLLMVGFSGVLVAAAPIFAVTNAAKNSTKRALNKVENTTTNVAHSLYDLFHHDTVENKLAALTHKIQHKKEPKYYLKRAALYMLALGDLDKAAADIEAAQKIKPSAYALHLLSLIHVKQQNWELALQDIDNAIALCSQAGVTLSQDLVSDLLKEEEADVHQEGKLATKLAAKTEKMKTSILAKFDPFHLSIKRENRKQKEKMVEQSLKLDLHLEDLYSNRASIKYKLGNEAEALQDYKYLIEQIAGKQKNSNYGRYNYNYGVVLFYQRRWEDAITAFTEALDNGMAENTKVIMYRSAAYQFSNQPQLAEQDKQMVLKINPNANVEVLHCGLLDMTEFKTILSFLASKELGNMESVSHRFYNIISSSGWKRLYFTERFVSYATLYQRYFALPKFKQTTELVIEEYNANRDFCSLALLKQLKSFTILKGVNYFSYITMEDESTKLLEQMPELESLEIHFEVGFPPALPNLKLKYLNVRGCKAFNDDRLLMVLTTLPDLVELDIRDTAVSNLELLTATPHKIKCIKTSSQQSPSNNN